MSDRRSYFAAAFNFRPFGMPVPPNWIGLAAFALLGGLLNPGFLLIGAGLELAYLFSLSRNQRFRKLVDAQAGSGSSWTGRYDALRQRLDPASVREQEEVEELAAEIGGLLRRNGAHESQISGVTQMTWLHLRLLAARSGFSEVRSMAQRERRDLDEQEREIARRLESGQAGADLQRSLEQRRDLIATRRAAHADAERRHEIVNAELERIRQQFALLREQALLSADDGSVARSLDGLSASLNEANRWLAEQRELFADFEDLGEAAPPADMLAARQRTRAKRAKGELE